MAKLNIDNFTQPKTGWSNGQKVLFIALTAGLGFLVWYLITKANEAKKLAEAKMAETYEKLKVTEQEKVATETVVSQTMGQGMLAHIQNIAKAQLTKDENPPNTEGSEPFSEVTS